MNLDFVATGSKKATFTTEKDISVVVGMIAEGHRVIEYVDNGILENTVTISASSRRLIAYTGEAMLENTIAIGTSSYISPVEWIEVGSGTVTGGDCVLLSDIGNIKTGDGTCEYNQDGTTYSSATNDTTARKVCGVGATYTTCVYEPLLDVWRCDDYIGSIPTVKFVCQLK